MPGCAKEVPVGSSRFLESLIEDLSQTSARPKHEVRPLVERMSLVVLRRLPAHASEQLAGVLLTERFPASAYRLDSGDPSLGYPDLLETIRYSGFSAVGAEEAEERLAVEFLKALGSRLPEEIREEVLGSMPAEFRHRM